LNVDIAQLLRQEDYVGAEALIRFYTETERYESLKIGPEKDERIGGRV